MLDNNVLKGVVARHVADVSDVEGDGVFNIKWLSTETFYRHTEEYISPEKRDAYRRDLELTFPGKKGVL